MRAAHCGSVSAGPVTTKSQDVRGTCLPTLLYGEERTTGYYRHMRQKSLFSKAPHYMAAALQLRVVPCGVPIAPLKPNFPWSRNAATEIEARVAPEGFDLQCLEEARGKG